MTYTLLAAAAYNALWGLWVGLFPKMSFDILGMEAPQYLPLWQSVGLMVGCYAIGYFLAAFDPYKLWGMVLVGFIGKVLGPLGMVYAVATEQLPLAFAWNNITNDVIWWVPFFLILRGAYKNHLETAPAVKPLSQALEVQTNKGRSLLEASAHPTLLVALRHNGCTFCRETLSDLQKARPTLEQRGVQVVLLLMEDNPEFLERYGVADLERVIDPEREVYTALHLKRGRLGQLFGLSSWTRGFEAGVLNKHGIGWLEGDGFQMPGTFVLHRGEIVKAFRHNNAADRVDYKDFCQIPAQ
jgi:peroxiredoxin